MSDYNPNENKAPTEDIGEQLRELGKNLREALRAAWEGEERRKLQQEIEVGLANLRDSLSEAAQDFSKSPAGQNLRDDVNDLRERFRTGEMGKKVQSEVADALRTVNDELKKATQKNPPPPPPPPPESQV